MLSRSPSASAIAGQAPRLGRSRGGRQGDWKTITRAASEGKLNYALSHPRHRPGLHGADGRRRGGERQGRRAVAGGRSTAGAIAAFSRATTGRRQLDYLAEKFIEQQGTKVNTFINYESWLLTLNNGGKLREKLVLVYPKEGVSTADYPFMLLQDARRADYQKVVAT
jgi:Ca-activated chloride channel family protein